MAQETEQPTPYAEAVELLSHSGGEHYRNAVNLRTGYRRALADHVCIPGPNPPEEALLTDYEIETLVICNGHKTQLALATRDAQHEKDASYYEARYQRLVDMARKVSEDTIYGVDYPELHAALKELTNRTDS